MLKVGWSYTADIWNVGAMIWDLFESRHMFSGEDLDGEDYSTRAHLAELVALLGPPPLDLLKRGKRVSEFFDDDGKFIADVPMVEASLEESEVRLEGDNKNAFLKFMRKLLQWRPEDRATARELLDDEWLNSADF